MGQTGRLILSVVGAIVGTVLGGNTALGWAVGSVLGAIIFPTQAPKLDLMTSSTIQNASVGNAVPVAYGTVRMAGNIIWIGDLHPYEPDTGGKKGGGKGGGKSSSGISFYRRSFLIGLCEGPIVGISKAWKGKDEEPVGNFTTFLGDGNAGLKTLIDNSTSPVGDTYTDYKHLACAFFSEYDLGSSEAIPNFNFEVNNLTDWIPISNAAELQAINENPWNPDAKYYLTNDISLDGVNFEPIAYFLGHFNGCGYAISDLTLTSSSPYYLGLFSYIASPVLIENVQLKNCNITNNYTNWSRDSATGCLVGMMFGGTIRNCSAEGSIAITGRGDVGGLAGLVFDDSYVYNPITEKYEDFPYLFKNCYSKVSVTCPNAQTGRPPGYGHVDNSAGGFCGIAYAGGDFIGCYSQGLVTQPGSGSGFIGCYFGHSIIDEYHSHSDAIRVYWDTETSGCEEGWGVAYFTDPLEVDYYQPNGFVAGKTTNEMYQQETYIPTSEWNFITDWQAQEPSP